MSTLRVAISPIFLLLMCTKLVCAQTATYEVTFDATWSAETHPGNYPANAHFSPLIGATHNADIPVWGPGGMATSGVEDMAETGSTVALGSELRRANRDGTVAGTLRGAGIDSPGTTSFRFEVERSHSLVSLVTMIAPSPDWFLGVHDLNLIQEDGNWIETVSVELFSYDAGTDSGTNFTSANLDTNPALPISLLGAPLEGTPPLGSFTFDLVAVPEPGSGALALVAVIYLFTLRLRQRVR